MMKDKGKPSYSQSIKIGARLKELRNTRNWSLKKMSEELDIMFENSPELRGLDLKNENSYSTISQFEHGARCLTVDTAIAYSRIFQASLDYIYCFSDVSTPENNDIHVTTGLSNKAILELQKYKDHDGTDNEIYNIDFENCTSYVVDLTKHTKTLNILLENEDRISLISNIAKYLFCSFSNMSPVNTRTGRMEIINGEDLNTMFLLNIQNQLHELKESLKNNSCQVDD